MASADADRKEDVEMASASGGPPVGRADTAQAAEAFRFGHSDREVAMDGLNQGIRGVSLYAAYVLSARVRFLFFFVIELLVVFVAKLAFVMSAIFSTMLPESRTHSDWKYRLAFFVPLAPFVLILGSWLIDSIVNLAVDANSPGVLLRARQKMAAFLHVLRNFRQVRAELPASLSADDASAFAVALRPYRYSGPALRRSTMVVVDLLVPVFMEVAPLAGAVLAAAEYRTLTATVSGYLTYGLVATMAVTVLDFFVDATVHLSPRFRATRRWLAVTGPTVLQRWVQPRRTEREYQDSDGELSVHNDSGEENDDLTSGGCRTSAAARGAGPAGALPLRPSNLGRSLRSEKYWHVRELKRRARKRHAAARRASVAARSAGLAGQSSSIVRKIAESADVEEHGHGAVSTASGASATDLHAKADRVARASCCERALDCWASVRARVRAVAWWSRFASVTLLYAAVSLLVAFEILPLGVGLLLVGLALFSLAFLVAEKVGDVLGLVYRVSVTFFFVLSLVMMAAALASREPASKLDLEGGVGASIAPLDSTRSVYSVCGSTWGGLDVLDLGILSELTYQGNDRRWRAQMRGAFGGTQLAEYEVVSRNKDDAVVNYRALRFAATNTTVVAIRGTSTTVEAYEDLFLFAGVVALQVVDSVLPVTRAMPSVFLERLMAALALPGIGAPPSWHPLLADLEELKAAGEKLVLTGHSLGGGLAAAMGARLGVQAVTFAAPGLYFNRGRFGFTEDGLRRHTLNVISEYDVVPLVDRQLGTVVHVRCPHESPLCHSISAHVCTLYEDCGDRRQRNWKSFCADRL